jgi:hypothetical protein
MTFNPNSGSLGYASYGSPQDMALRLAQAQLAEGASTAPIRSKWQGVARLSQALQGGWSMGQAQKAGQANAAYLQPGGNGGNGATGATGGLPADPNGISDLSNAIGPVPNLTDADFNGLQDSDIMGPGPQQGPPPAAMAPNNGRSWRAGFKPHGRSSRQRSHRKCGPTDRPQHWLADGRRTSREQRPQLCAWASTGFSGPDAS